MPNPMMNYPTPYPMQPNQMMPPNPYGFPPTGMYPPLPNSGMFTPQGFPYMHGSFPPAYPPNPMGPHLGYPPIATSVVAPSVIPIPLVTGAPVVAAPIEPALVQPVTLNATTPVENVVKETSNNLITPQASNDAVRTVSAVSSTTISQDPNVIFIYENDDESMVFFIDIIFLNIL